MLKKEILAVSTLLAVLLCGCNGSDGNTEIVQPDTGGSGEVVQPDTDGSGAASNVITQQEVLQKGTLANGDYIVKDALTVGSSNNVTIANNATLTIK